MGVLFGFERVSLQKGTRTVLDDIDVEIPDTGVTAIVGASGAGKSSLLRCCNRLEVPTSGRVTYRGRDLASLPPRAHRRQVAMVFQSPTAFPGSVLDNLRSVRPSLTEAAAADLCRRVGLDPDLLGQTADALSGGEAQRMVVARALTTDPVALLADEATSSLDATATGRLERLARRLADEGIPIVWVTHDLDQVLRVADWLVVMQVGRVLWAGDAASTEAGDVIADALADADEDAHPDSSEPPRER